MRGISALALGMAAVSLLLAGCGSSQRWAKQGVEPAQIAADYSACSSEGQTAIGPDSNIDTDILSGRQHDWERTNTLQAHRSTDVANDDAHSGDIVQACMIGKGYVPTGSAPQQGPAVFDFSSILNIF